MLSRSSEPLSAPGSSLRKCYCGLIVIAVAAGILLRLVGLSDPPFDRHSFRQTQTLSTIEDFHAHGIDFLHPKTIYMGFPGIFVLELPVFQAVAALLYKTFGAHLEMVRLLNIALGLATALVLFRITARLLDRTTAWLTASIYWLAPLNVLYHRSTLIDPTAVFFGLLAFHQLLVLMPFPEGKEEENNSKTHRSQFALFVVAVLLTTMTKALYLWPVVLLFAHQAFARRLQFDVRTARVLAVFVLAGCCFLAWNVYATHENDGSIFTRGVRPTSLLGVSALSTGDYYFQLAPRIKWWLGAFAFLFPVGIVVAWKQRNKMFRFHALVLVFLIPPTYLILFASINRPHEYYQLIITPFLAMMPAIAIRWLATLFQLENREKNSRRRAAVMWTCLGSALLYLAGFLLWLSQRDPTKPLAFMMVLLAPPSYLLFLAAISSPLHLLMPARRPVIRCATIAGIGTGLILISAFVYLGWLRQPEQDLQTHKFQRLCLGKFLPQSPAMLFVAGSTNGDDPNNDIPHYLYAAKLWGFGRTVENEKAANRLFQEYSHGFQKLDYLVFYGMDCPNWVPAHQFRLEFSDEQNRLFAYRATKLVGNN